MKLLSAILYIVGFSVFSQIVLASPSNSSPANSSSSPANSSPANPEFRTPTNGLPSGYLSCPKISDLQKDSPKMVWFAKNGWLSYAASFATHIDKFLWTQWQEVNLRNITCLYAYASNEKMTFPITLEYNLLVYQPTGRKWSKNLGGYANCKASNQYQCIFKPQAQLKVGDVYQQASQPIKEQRYSRRNGVLRIRMI
ncbi:T4SS-associated protein EirA [Coxiella-like endosymbiont]|uniref:T4SS-associated protein EirA n=1 Tax=Coxiella-like endosymbiont TaxID=1592897 RepID=UPI00272C8F50|nr:T4SS-associated protein EirA [Coxiella-like endosymbiont]